jgi:hypothetical protein
MKYAIVIGSGPFPIDMLRYDCCSPATEEDSHIIERSMEGWKKWEVCVKCDLKNREWTAGRWQSFGCSIFPMEKGYMPVRRDGILVK